MKLKLQLALIVPFMLYGTFSNAQNRNLNKSKSERNEPEWVAMMDDSTVNYFKATKAFDDYWKNKVKPMEANDNDLANMNAEEIKEHKEFVEKLKRMSPSERNEYENLCFQYKRFSNWMYEVKPFVQPNGHVLTAFEQRKIWEQQQIEKRMQLSK